MTLRFLKISPGKKHIIISLKVFIFSLLFFSGGGGCLSVAFHLYNPSKSECVEYEPIKLPKLKYVEKFPPTWTLKHGCLLGSVKDVHIKHP